MFNINYRVINRDRIPTNFTVRQLFMIGDHVLLLGNRLRRGTVLKYKKYDY